MGQPESLAQRGGISDCPTIQEPVWCSNRDRRRTEGIVLKQARYGFIRSAEGANHIPGKPPLPFIASIWRMSFFPPPPFIIFIIFCIC
jgi:hypothetical protein